MAVKQSTISIAGQTIDSSELSLEDNEIDSLLLKTKEEYSKLIEKDVPDLGVAATSMFGAIKSAKMKEGSFSLSSPINIIEGTQLLGSGYQLPGDTQKSSTVINNSTTDSTIVVNGQWDGFDSRRFVEIGNFSINANGAAERTINVDFLTIFDIHKLFTYGNSAHHLYMNNSYNGDVKNSRFYGATVANVYFKTDDANPVFSGQTTFEGVDFWSAKNGTDDAAGIAIEADGNLIEQLLFSRCHWQDNDYGMWVKSGGDKTIIAGHFEANLQHDLLVNAGADNPKILSGVCNNGQTTTSCFALDGLGGCINNLDFMNVTNDAYCIDVRANCDGLSMENIDILRKNGATMKGLKISGKNININGLKGRTAGSAATWPLITFEPGARNITVQRVSYDNFGSAAPMVDNGAENITFEDAKIVESKEFDLDGGEQIDAFPTEFRGYINRAWLIYTEAPGAGTTTLNVGRSVSAGTVDHPRYVSVVTTANTPAFTRIPLAIASTNYLAASDALTFRCVGDAGGAGKVKVVVEITPYRALT